MPEMLQVGEVAKAVGVSIRTMHHYDRIGLLSPSGRSESGYRLYNENDLLRLQHILTLRYLGFPLRQIRKLLQPSDLDLTAALDVQRIALRRRLEELAEIERAVSDLLEKRRETGDWDWKLVTAASAASQKGLSNKGEEMTNIQQQFDELGRKIGDEKRRQVEELWSQLIADVRANLQLDPASPEAQALGDRWNKASEEMAELYREYPQLWEHIGKQYENEAFKEEQRAPQPADFAFINAVNAARKQ